MKFPLQILFLFLAWFTNTVNATPFFVKVVLQFYETSFSKPENQNLESEIKIGVEHFARSGISGDRNYQKAIFWESYILENRAREANVWGVKGAGKIGLLSKLDNFTNLKTWIGSLDEVADASLVSKIDNLATSNPSKLSQLDDLYNPSKFQMTAGGNRIPINSPAPFQASINGKSVNYNSQGFPDFKPHSGGTSFEFKSNSLTGTGSATAGDFKAANDWALSNPALSGKFQTIPGSQKCLVKFGDDWIECT